MDSANNRKEIGRIIREARLRHDPEWTQEDLAEKAGDGFSKQTISLYERGETAIPRKKAIRLEEVLELPAGTLQEGSYSGGIAAGGLAAASGLLFSPAAVVALAVGGAVLLFRRKGKKMPEPSFVSDRLKPVLTAFTNMDKTKRAEFLRMVEAFIPQEEREPVDEETQKYLRSVVNEVYGKIRMRESDRKELMEDVTRLMIIFLGSGEQQQERLIKALT